MCSRALSEEEGRCKGWDEIWITKDRIVVHNQQRPIDSLFYSYFNHRMRSEQVDIWLIEGIRYWKNEEIFNEAFKDDFIFSLQDPTIWLWNMLCVFVRLWTHSLLILSFWDRFQNNHIHVLFLVVILSTYMFNERNYLFEAVFWSIIR